MFDWVNNTGQGVLSEKCRETFEQAVRSCCKWHFELEPTMADRRKRELAVTTETMDDTSDSSALAPLIGSAAKESDKDGPTTFVEPSVASTSTKRPPSAHSASRKKKQPKGQESDCNFMEHHLSEETV